MNKILIVVGGSLKEYGVMLVQIFSQNPNINATICSLKEWSNNESEYLINNNYVLFLGENPVSSPYIKTIDRKYSDMGIVYGYKDKIATIYLQYIEKDIHRLRKEVLHIDRKFHTRYTDIAFYATFFYIYVPVLLYRTIKERRSLQYRYGIMQFADKCMLNYFGIKAKE